MKRPEGRAPELLRVLVCLLLSVTCLVAAEVSVDPIRERQVRERYEAVLMKNPFQDRAFDAVYEGYSRVEGVEEWVKALKSRVESEEEGLSAMLLLGRIYDRQFRTAEAIKVLERAGERGEEGAAFKVLLGTLYYKAGRDEAAAKLLGEGLEGLEDLEQRSAVCRMLGNLYLRQGKRAEAIEAWKRIAEQNPGEVFAQLELAEIYQDNRMWVEAIGVYRQIAEMSKDDPYRRCTALQSLARCLVEAGRNSEATDALQEALELAAPGSAVFEEVARRLVDLHEDIGRLPDLAQSLERRLAEAPGDVDVRALLAETRTRMGAWDLAEKEYRSILERHPRSAGAYEKLIGLYAQQNRTNELFAAFEKLLELFPRETDYIRRLGAARLAAGDKAGAMATWRRIVEANPSAARFAELAGWLESYDLRAEAIEAYEEALKRERRREWVFHLAALEFKQGAEAEAVKRWLSAADPATASAAECNEVASILEVHERYAEAGGLRKRALELEPENLDLRLAYARNLARQKKYEAALAEYEALAGQDTNDFIRNEGERGMLDALTELGLLSQRQAQWERELERNPRSEVLLKRLALVCARNGQQERAVQLLERRRALDPANANYTRDLARAYRLANRPHEAIRLFSHLTETDRGRASAHLVELLELQVALGWQAEAIATAERIVQLMPSSPDARLRLAEVYARYGEHDKALVQYRAVIELKPNDAEYRRLYGDALLRMNRLDEALAAYREGVVAASDDEGRMRLVQALARVAYELGREEALVDEFKARLRATPGRLSVYEELAAVYRETHQPLRALEVLEEAARLVDDKTAALKSMMRAAYETEDLIKALEAYRKLMALSGQPSAAEYERLAQLHAQLGDDASAKEAWKKVLELSAGNADALERAAAGMWRMGYRREALECLARAVEANPGDFRVRYEYARYLSENGDRRAAYKQLRTLLEIGDTGETSGAATPSQRGVRARDALTEHVKMLAARVRPKQSGTTAVTLPSGQVVSVPQTPSGGATVERIVSVTFPKSGWTGSYEDFKTQVLVIMFQLALSIHAEQEVLDHWRLMSSSSLEAKRELVLLLLTGRFEDEAVRAAEEVLAAQPADADWVSIVATMRHARADADEAIALYEKMMEGRGQPRWEAVRALIPLYIQRNENGKINALMQKTLAEGLHTNEISFFHAVVQGLQKGGRMEQARVLCREALKSAGPGRVSLLLNLASFERRAGRTNEAIELFTEVLFSSGQPTSVLRTRVGSTIHKPLQVLSSSGGSRVLVAAPGGTQVRQPPGFVDPLKTMALTSLRALAGSGPAMTQVVARLEAQLAAERAEDPSDAERGWETAQLLIAHHTAAGNYAAAEAVLETTRMPGAFREEWCNQALYVANLQGKYGEMARLYEEWAEHRPGAARELMLARIQALLFAREFAAAANAIRNWSYSSFNAREFAELIEWMVRGQQHRLAEELLNEYMATNPREPNLLVLQARAAAAQGKYSTAIDLAEEAWKRSDASRGATPTYGLAVRSSGNLQTLGAPEMDPLLQDVHRYYAALGRTKELIERFRKQLEEHPSSPRAHEHLAQVYQLDGKRDEAIQVYKELLEKYPRSASARLALAKLLLEQGDQDGAIKEYEELERTHADLAPRVRLWLQTLRQRGQR
ncbi:MAG TPA: tetratricopeptide repeat protein [Verrucomicrobia bacterium]|nr:tetratricopeptide repeat protein [Verrucomicrobiota bacterium]HOP97875.1 tetratricopeptide repeat protein [Verrucomicrobiota bacterium]